MWIVGDWGQTPSWTRAAGVKMVKGGDGVYTGELSLPKGTKFDIKILKSTVSEMSGGDNTWSAVRYASTLNRSASHDFGGFSDNLIPNGNFDEGQVKWTPAECVKLNDSAPFDGKNVLNVGGDTYPASCTSDVFVLPPNQTLRLTGSIKTFTKGIDGIVTMKVVTPQQQVLFELREHGYQQGWSRFSRTFKTADVPMECRIVLTNVRTDAGAGGGVCFDSLSLVSP